MSHALPPALPPVTDPRLTEYLHRLADEADLPHWSDDARHAFREAHQWACRSFDVDCLPLTPRAAPRSGPAHLHQGWLVRDLVPAVVGPSFRGHVAPARDRPELLARALQRAAGCGTLDEAADAFELLHALCSARGWSLVQVAAAREDRALRYGRFDDSVVST